MANRPKTERNNKILKLWDDGKGWRQASIARMFKISPAAVQMVIWRAKQRENHSEEELKDLRHIACDDTIG